MKTIPMEGIVKKAMADGTMPAELAKEIDWKIGMQEEHIENEPDWKGEVIDYELAFDDAWDAILDPYYKKESRYLVSQIKDWLIEVGYYIDQSHPDWKAWSRMGTTYRKGGRPFGGEFKHKKVWYQLRDISDFGSGTKVEI